MFTIKKLIITLSLPFLLINGSIFAGKKGKGADKREKLSKEDRAASKEYYAQKKEREAQLKQLKSRIETLNFPLRTLQSRKKEFLYLQSMAKKGLSLYQSIVEKEKSHNTLN